MAIERESPLDLATIGTRLRAARQRKGLSLDDVARETGLSKGFLSLVENGKSDISIGRLVGLLGKYNMSIEDLTEEGRQDGSPVVVTLNNRRRSAVESEHVEKFLLAPNTRGRRMMPVVVRCEANATLVECARHEGEEFIHVMDGSVQLEIDDGEVYALEEGDSAYLRATIGHRLHAGPEGAVIFRCGESCRDGVDES